MTDEQEFLTKQLETHLDLYKFYFEMALKISVFSIGLTGAIVSYYFANKDANDAFVHALYIPAAVSGSLLALFLCWLKTVPPMQNDLERIASEINQKQFAYSLKPITILFKGLLFLNIFSFLALCVIVLIFN